MPNPLVILENHYDTTAAKKFIINNAGNLKSLGYKKVLLEVPKEHSPASYKSQLKRCVVLGQQNPNSLEASTMAHAKPMLEMLETLDKYQIPYEFIDPRSESDDQKMLLEAMQKFRSGGYKSEQEMKEQLIAANIAKAKVRDRDMSSTYTQQAKENDGGVIFHGGFMHKELVTFLQTNSPNCRYAIFNNSLEKLPIVGDPQSGLRQTWSQLSDDAFRNQFFGAHVSYFDLATNPSFLLIESACRLTTSESCFEPAAGRYLSQSTKQKYSYVIDKEYVVSASTNVDNGDVEKVASTIKNRFPGLRFFTEKELTTTSLSIPGINLPENKDALTKGFTDAGVYECLSQPTIL